MTAKLENIRNIGIIAHIDAGKTTVTEWMLYVTEAKHRAGEVDKGTTTTDSDPEEAQRGITIYAACVAFNWKDVEIHLIDTPGHVDFTAEVERSLRVLDGGVVVFSAREGVEAQSETVWRQADKYRVPRVAFINKMDREGADFERTFTQIIDRLGSNPVAIQVPIGQGPSHSFEPFRGIVDLVTMELLTFPEGKQGRRFERGPIPDDVMPKARKWRDKMLEQLYDYSNELMELALQEAPISVELIRRVLRDATVHLQIQPVLCGAALHGIGVQPLLDAVQFYLPSPLDVPPVEGTNPTKKDAIEKRSPDPDEPFCGLVFKILPFKTGDLYWVRVYSGTLKPNSRALVPGKDQKENIAQLWRIHASKREEQLTEALCGDIVGVIGPRYAVTGDTLCDTRNPILLENIRFPETVISMAIEPESTADRKKLFEVLEMHKRQDPTFRASESEETGQTIISGMGELHLEVFLHKLERDFNLNVKVHNPRVSYRETVKQPVEVEGRCNRLVAGQQISAAVKLRVEPFASSIAGGETTVVTNRPNCGLPDAFLEATLEVLREQASGGGYLGFPLMNVKVTVLGGTVHETESTEIAFRFAAADAMNKALSADNIVLLEPIMKLELTVPEEHMGEFVGDLQQRRAIIQSTDQLGTTTLIHAEAPLARLFGYSSAMRSLSQGRASCSMEPLRYGPAPEEELRKFLQS